MKNISHEKKWNAVKAQVHVDPPLIPVLKCKTRRNQINIVFKLDCVGYTKSERLDLSELTMALFNNGKLEEIYSRGIRNTFSCSKYSIPQFAGTLIIIKSVWHIVC